MCSDLLAIKVGDWYAQQSDMKAEIKQALVKLGITKVVELIIWLIFTGAVTLLSSDVLTRIYPILKPFQGYIGVILTALGLLIVIGIFNRVSRFRPRFPLVQCDYQIKKKLRIITSLMQITSLTPRLSSSKLSKTASTPTMIDTFGLATAPRICGALYKGKA